MSLMFGFLPAQGKFFLKEDVSKKIEFQFINNLIIVPIEINGVKLSFVLDTGVSKPILFNLSEKDSLDLKNVETFYLHGLGGDGKIQAIKSSYNKLKIGDAIGLKQDVYVVFDRDINFASRLGVLVHGIIGYNIFKDFVVEINYGSEYIRLYKPDSYRPKISRKWETIPLKIYNKKPYINARVNIEESINKVKLLIDTGSSDALWLFEETELGIEPNEDLFFEDYLGKGLSGSVYGKRSKVDMFSISEFDLKNVNVAFPDSLSVDITKTTRNRKGSLGGEILKRFRLFFDYTHERLYLKKNNMFKDPFTYNNSGIVFENDGFTFFKEKVIIPVKTNYGKHEGSSTSANSGVAFKLRDLVNYRTRLKPLFKIVELRKSSNAYLVGLKIGDLLVGINGKKVGEKTTLAQINEDLYGKTGRTIRLSVMRNGQIIRFKFKLDNAFKKEEHSN
ncbi:MAG: signaling protein [Flavobacteriaceae bacterium]|nr:signaling protein [Flavobacteriaceae bacterium]